MIVDSHVVLFAQLVDPGRFRAQLVAVKERVADGDQRFAVENILHRDYILSEILGSLILFYHTISPIASLFCGIPDRICAFCALFENKFLQDFNKIIDKFRFLW